MSRSMYYRTLFFATRAVFRAIPMPVRVRSTLAEFYFRWRVRRRASERSTPEAELQAERVSFESAYPGYEAKAALRRRSESALSEFLASEATLDLPVPSTEPQLSVIVVCHEQASLTLACLQALAESDFRDFEVILVDNASRDRTGELLERLRHCTVVRNAVNRHFLRGCNQAADYARGRYLLFLNNDACPSRVAIGRALRVFGEEERVGAVGGRLILPDGTLQEAGSVVWSDGSCLGYGQGEDPSDPRFGFRREVDFCCGAFLMTPRDVFERLGRFDERFAPAYYEEADYCLSLWEHGYRVLYEPGVSVEHFAYGSSSREDAAVLARRNQFRFLEKHRAKLKSHPAFRARNLLRARSARREAPKVLYIHDRFPHRDLGMEFHGANELIWAMIGSGCEVTIYAVDQRWEDPEEIYRDLPPSLECLYGDRGQGLLALLEERRGFYSRIVVSRPLNMEALDRVIMRRSGLVRAARIVYVADASCPANGVPESDRARHGEVPDPVRDSPRIREAVRNARHADVVIAASRADADEYQRLSGKRVLLFEPGACRNSDAPAGQGNGDGREWLAHSDSAVQRAAIMREALNLKASVGMYVAAAGRAPQEPFDRALTGRRVT